MGAESLCFKIAGEAGQGINVSTLTLAHAFTRKGYYAFLLTENPNSIKLEHNWCSLRVATRPLTAQTHEVDILVVLNKYALIKRQPEVVRGGVILYDGETIKLEEKERRPECTYLSVPLAGIIKSLKAPELLRNTVALGAVLAIIDYGLEMMEDILRETFSKKGEAVVGQNIDALEAGYKFAREGCQDCFKERLPRAEGKPRMFLTGNEALSVGAIKAGCKFFAAYPMTPSSPILHFLASKEREYNIVVKHTEDELAAMNMAIGAGFAGARSMTATAGGGFCLMTEALGMAGQSETPVVVVMGERPGPSTGQPTHTSQADLRFVIYASQGEFPRIVIAPGDARECFYETFNAFNLAERFQVPVLILTDKYLAESYVTQDEFSSDGLTIDRGRLLSQAELDKISDYKRYEFTSDGISRRAIPSQSNGMHIATSYEHDEYGFYQEDPDGVRRMMDKRFAKLPHIEASLKPPELYGPKEAQITILAWGSSKGPILEALEMLRGDKIIANFLHLVYIWPFPAEAVTQVLKGAKKTIGIEANRMGQMCELIAEKTRLDLDYKFLKYDGQPFYPVEVYKKIKDIV